MSIQDEINFQKFLESQSASNDNQWEINDLNDSQEC